jgi:hypothetical protein
LVDGVDELGSEVVRRSEVRFSPSVKLTNTNNIDYLHWPYQKNNNMHACMINKMKHTVCKSIRCICYMRMRIRISNNDKRKVAGYTMLTKRKWMARQV